MCDVTRRDRRRRWAQWLLPGFRFRFLFFSVSCSDSPRSNNDPSAPASDDDPSAYQIQIRAPFYGKLFCLTLSHEKEKEKVGVVWTEFFFGGAFLRSIPFMNERSLLLFAKYRRRCGSLSKIFRTLAEICAQRGGEAKKKILKIEPMTVFWKGAGIEMGFFVII